MKKYGKQWLVELRQFWSSQNIWKSKTNPRNEQKQFKEFNDHVKLDKSAIKKGYDRVREKIKAVRQDYRIAVNNGTRSGSGRIIRDNWDDLTQIWAVSPAMRAIKNACKTREVNGESTSKIREDEDQETLEKNFDEIKPCKEADSWPHLQPEQ